jgi:DNA replication protein DnaC
MFSTVPKTVAFTTEDRQWDARFNVQDDADLTRLLDAIGSEWDKGKFKYVLVGGVEIGTRPYQDDYQIKHVHVAAIFHNRVSKRAILKNWNVKEGNGYYLVPRNRDLPYSGWKNHHIKEFSKVDKTKCTLYEMGTLPEDIKKPRVHASEEEKKRKIDDILIEMKDLIEKDQGDEAFRKFPRNYLTYGEKIKAMVTQKRNFFKTNGNPHIWLYGYPGTGKTAILSYIYPNYYKKNLHNKFFDLYDPKEHTHIMLEDLDHEAVERLSMNFLKTICDEAGFPIDQKYKTPQLVRSTVLVTSNFRIPDICEANEHGGDVTKTAILRRFWHVDIMSLLRLLGVKLLPKYERQQMAKEGNTDPGKLFITWDYLTDTPLCMPLRSPEEYQQTIKDHFYA